MRVTVPTYTTLEEDKLLKELMDDEQKRAYWIECSNEFNAFLQKWFTEPEEAALFAQFFADTFREKVMEAKYGKPQ
jgi:hypothetical protein